MNSTRPIKILIFLVALFLASFAHATDYTSSQAGNWSSSSTWGGAGVPGNGDTATVGHAVTVDTNTTVGTSPSDQTTMVITIGSAGSLTVADGITLTVRGNIYNNAGTSGNPAFGILWGAGSKVLLDSSQATNDQQVYILKGGYYGMYYALGTSANFAEIESLEGYGKAVFTSVLGAYGNCFDATYMKFTRMGDDSTAFLTSQAGASGGAYGSNSDFDHCIFDQFGAFKLNVSGDGGNISLTNCRFTNPAETGSLAVWFAGRISGSGTEVLNNNVFECNFYSTPNGASAQNNYFGNRLSIGTPSGIGGGFSLFKDNFIRDNSASSMPFDTDATDLYLLDDSGYGNPSTLSLGAKYESRTLDSFIIDNNGTATQGDMLLPGGNELDTGLTNTITRGIFLPQSAGKACGKFISNVYETDYTTVIAERNTVFSGIGSEGSTPETGVGVGEDDVGHTGEIAAFRSNLVWNSQALQGCYKLVRQQSAKQDFVLSSNSDYNWGWNISAGSEGNGYHCWDGYQTTALFSSGTPDVHGGTGDPDFEDYTRNCATYDIAGLNNPPGTAWADATGYTVGDIVSTASSGFYGNTTINFRCILSHTSESGHATNGQPGAVSGWRTNWELATLYRLRQDVSKIADLIDWVQAGFVPHNASLDGTGYGGVDIGAMDYVSNDPATYYVDATGGSDSNTGLTAEDAWQTLTKANSHTCVAGDYVLFKRGEEWEGTLYGTADGTSENRIYYGAYGTGALPIINAGRNIANASWTKTGGYTNIYEFSISGGDLDFLFTPASGNWGTVWKGEQWMVVETFDTDLATTLTNMDSNPGYCYYDITGDKIYIHSQDSANPISDGAKYVISMYKDNIITDGYDHLTFEDLHLIYGTHHNFLSYDWAQTNTSTDVIFKNSTVEYTKHDMVGLTGDTILVENIIAKHAGCADTIFIVSGTGSGSIVRDCTISDTEWLSASGKSTTAVKIESTPSNFTVDGLSIESTAILKYAFAVDGAANPSGTNTISGIVVEAGASLYGFAALQSSTGIILEDNQCNIITDSSSVVLQTSTSPVLRRNKFAGSNGGAVVHFGSVTTPSIILNVLNGGGSAAYGIYAQACTGNGYISNNTIVNATRGIQIDAGISGGLLYMQNNIINGTTYPIQIADVDCYFDYNAYGDWTDGFRMGGANYNFTEWTALLNSYSIGGEDAHSISTELKLNSNFMLKADSPCIDAGTDVSLTQDKRGRAVPQGTAPDIGAYEGMSEAFPLGTFMLSDWSP